MKKNYNLSEKFSKILNLTLDDSYDIDYIFVKLFEYASSNNLTEVSPNHNIYILDKKLEEIFLDFDNSSLTKKLEIEIIRLKSELNFLNDVSSHPIYNHDNFQITNLKNTLNCKENLLNRLKTIKFININDNRQELISYLENNKIIY
jgi:hypothetical protein